MNLGLLDTLTDAGVYVLSTQINAHLYMADYDEAIGPNEINRETIPKMIQMKMSDR